MSLCQNLYLFEMILENNNISLKQLRILCFKFMAQEDGYNFRKCLLKTYSMRKLKTYINVNDH